MQTIVAQVTTQQIAQLGTLVVGPVQRVQNWKRPNTFSKIGAWSLA